MKRFTFVLSALAIAGWGPAFGDVVTIDIPGASLTAAETINGSGLVGGFFDDSTETTHGFLLVNGTSSPVDVPGATATLVKGVNDNGTVIGDYVQSNIDHAFSLNSGSFQSIDFPGASGTFAGGINSASAISGTYFSDGVDHAFVLTGGVYSPIDFPGATDTFAGGLNNSGQLTGYYDVGGAIHGFLLSGESFSSFDAPGALATFGADINDSGELVGYYLDSNGLFHGFLMENGAFSTIDVPGADDTFAKGINDLDQVVGFYDVSNNTHGFETVVSEPGGLIPLLFGLALTLCIGRFKGAWRGPLLKTSILLAAGMVAAFVPGNVQAQSSLTFVAPQPGGIVGGDQVLLWVAADPTIASNLTRFVTFEVSADGVNFVALTPVEAPDLGPGSYTTSLDSTALPVGTTYLRARFSDDSTGPVLQVDVRRIPVPSCEVIRLSSRGVSLDCSGSTDSNGGISSFDFDFGDGTDVTGTSPSATHIYSRLGIFPIAVIITDQAGLSASLFKQLLLIQAAALADRPSCGCKQLNIATTGNSTLKDNRRPKQGGGLNPSPLGLDPTYASFNFEGICHACQ